jgi:acetate kinase
MRTPLAEDRDFPPGGSRPDRSCLLTVNGGSSSLKFALFDAQAGDNSRAPRRHATGWIERIGLPGSRMAVAESNAGAHPAFPVSAPDLRTAAGLVADWLEREVGAAAVAAVGFRIVHGGPRYHLPQRVTADVVAELRRIIPLDVDHLPGQIEIIECFGERLPELAQVACFDTGFHHELPRVAQIVPVPRRLEADGVRRYGFHGLSFAYLMEELARRVGADAASGRVILAHLGSGSSLAAVHHRRCVETTMGLTPASGLVMGTRAGDIDPGLPLFLSRALGQNIEQFHALVNHESGLLGISETSPDFRDLLARRDHDVRAAEAIAVFLYQAKKAVGALAAVMAGLDLLVFSGGIGENSPEARAGICEGLDYLGISLDPDRNQAGASPVSRYDARTAVHVIHTDEESMIARATAAALAGSA